MKSFFCYERPCIAWQNCVRFFCAFIMFWANNAWLEQRTRSHAHVLYFSILTLKPCITGNLFPLCLFLKYPTPKRCDFIYHILWNKSSALISSARSIFCYWSFFHSSESLSTEFTKLTTFLYHHSKENIHMILIIIITITFKDALCDDFFGIVGFFRSNLYWCA